MIVLIVIFFLLSSILFHLRNGTGDVTIVIAVSLLWIRVPKEPSDSEWASPAFIVPKKQKGQWGWVVHYKGLNTQTEHDSYSLPVIDFIPQKQQKKRTLTVLYLQQGYHMMPLHEDSRP